MVKFLLILCCITFAVASALPSGSEKSSNAADDQKNSTYTTKYDNVDLDEVLHSDRLLLNYVNCLLGKARCTPDGKELKDNLPDAIDNDCKKCSEKQKEGSARVMHYIIDNKPTWWDELELKFNPDGSYKNKYMEEKKKNEEENDEEK